MSSQTITVAAIEAPGIGKKQGRIVDSTGKKWNVWADKLANYQQFRTYEIIYETNEFKGIIFDVIKSAVAVGGESPPPRTSAANYQSPPKTYTNPPATYDDNQRRMDIFVCGAFNNAMANPNTNPLVMNAENMIMLINNLKTAWKRTLGPQAQPTLIRGGLDNELNDEIPFE